MRNSESLRGEVARCREECSRQIGMFGERVAISERSVQANLECLRDARLGMPTRARALEMLRSGVAADTTARELGMATARSRPSGEGVSGFARAARETDESGFERRYSFSKKRWIRYHALAYRGARLVDSGGDEGEAGFERFHFGCEGVCASGPAAPPPLSYFRGPESAPASAGRPRNRRARVDNPSPRGEATRGRSVTAIAARMNRRSEAKMTARSRLTMTAVSMVFSSSRTLPGQA